MQISSLKKESLLAGAEPTSIHGLLTKNENKFLSTKKNLLGRPIYSFFLGFLISGSSSESLGKEILRFDDLLSGGYSSAGGIISTSSSELESK